MNVQHTPGPWQVSTDGSDVIEICGNKGRLTGWVAIAMSASSPAECAANAHLIAAAPDLLEALTMVRDADEDCIRDHLTRMPPTARKLIDDAIAKAVQP